MAEDWRATLVFEDEQEEHESLIDRLRGFRPEKELEEELPSRVVVSHDGPELFLYADTRSELERALTVAKRVLSDEGTVSGGRIERWHDIEERWEPASEPLPDTPAEEQEERDALAARERAESRVHGAPEWQVRVDLPDRRAATALEERLQADGLRPLRRWRFIVLGVDSEEDGQRLADRIRALAPEGSGVWVEGSLGSAERSRPFGNVFAVFGGLGN
jgi:hypothetical protein